MTVLSRLIIRCVVAVIVISCAAPLRAASSVPQLFLVQNSGWMLPFYDDPNSKFKDLVAELTGRVRQYGGEQQVIASFNQTLGDNKSPKLHYKGVEQNKINEAIRSIEPARKPGRSTYADTDFKEAIIGAVKEYSPGQSCLIWIITNNKNSPDNSSETVERNKEFYRFLQTSTEIRRIVAFPYQMKVRSKSLSNFSANGLMIYAMAYGDQADQLLQQMLAANAPFGKQAARLKPLDAEALTFVPKGVKDNSKVTATVPDKKTLVLSFDAASKPETAEIVGQFRNDFYPYDIRSAAIGMSAAFKGGTGITSQLSTTSLSNVPAGGMSGDVSVKISVPPIPSPLSPEVIFGSGYKSRGTLNFELTDQQLVISKDFVAAMAELFPNDPLPELFTPGESAKKSATVQPMIIQVVYPMWPTILAGLLLLLVVGGGIAAAILMRKEIIYRISVDGTQRTIGLRPNCEAVIKNAQGERVGVLKRGFGKPTIIIDKGISSSVRLM